MQIRRKFAIPLIAAAALFGTGGIAYANVANTPTPTPTVSETPTVNPTPIPFTPRNERIPVFCYYQSPSGVQGSIVEFNWDHERYCPRGFTPITLRDLLRFFIFNGPFPSPLPVR